jgi:hypothetical protein
MTKAHHKAVTFQRWVRLSIDLVPRTSITSALLILVVVRPRLLAGPGVATSLAMTKILQIVGIHLHPMCKQLRARVPN